MYAKTIFTGWRYNIWHKLPTEANEVPRKAVKLDAVVIRLSRGTMSNPNDKIYTPSHIVDEVLDIFLPMIGKNQTILEPFKGDGAFYDKLPTGSMWCEIDDGVDFLSHEGMYDWIITNPPYSTFKEMLPKLLASANDVVLVIPTNKLLSSMPRLMDIKRAGFNLRRIHYLGSGRQIKFPFGFPVGAMHLKRGYLGDVEITYAERCQHAKAK